MISTRFVTRIAFFAVVMLIMGQALWAALVVNINGPTNVWVPFDRCVWVGWTASANQTISTYDWTWNSRQVSTYSSYGRNFCSPGLGYATTTFDTLGLYATGGGYADFDSISVHAIYQAGNENGPCGTQVVCWP